MPWIPTNRDRVVLFYNFIPQFYFSDKPPTTITPDGRPILQGSGRDGHAPGTILANDGLGLDKETKELISVATKGVMKGIVKKHLATSVAEEGASPVPPYHPSDEL